MYTYRYFCNPHFHSPFIPVYCNSYLKSHFVQFVVFDKGIVGPMGEHSVIDGMGLQLSIKINDAVTKP